MKTRPIWTIKEKQADGSFERLVLEGLCNPYSNPESARIDFEWLKKHKNGLGELVLAESCVKVEEWAHKF